MKLTLSQSIVASLIFTSTLTMAAPWQSGYSNGNDFYATTDKSGSVKFVLSCDGFATTAAEIVNARSNKQLAYNYAIPGVTVMSVTIDGQSYPAPFSQEVYNTPQKFSAFYNAFRNAHSLEMTVVNKRYTFPTEGLKQAFPAYGSHDYKCHVEK
ncbi:hypothetical protein [Serratia fonticola]|uniref:hypothetical protein n=1 Tax=Serratia fonticola TaxID=47917 RepID=UPI001645676D|nr:hypothetical protein [Serratia fonticola]MBC3230432.1 hypothetical protein [Serratia fonticola]